MRKTLGMATAGLATVLAGCGAINNPVAPTPVTSAPAASATKPTSFVTADLSAVLTKPEGYVGRGIQVKGLPMGTSNNYMVLQETAAPHRRMLLYTNGSQDSTNQGLALFLAESNDGDTETMTANVVVDESRNKAVAYRLSAPGFGDVELE